MVVGQTLTFGLHDLQSTSLKSALFTHLMCCRPGDTCAQVRLFIGINTVPAEQHTNMAYAAANHACLHQIYGPPTPHPHRFVGCFQSATSASPAWLHQHRTPALLCTPTYHSYPSVLLLPPVSYRLLQLPTLECCCN